MTTGDASYVNYGDHQSNGGDESSCGRGGRDPKHEQRDPGGLQTGDAGTEALLSAISGQVLEASQLMTALTPHLGQNLNTGA